MTSKYTLEISFLLKSFGITEKNKEIVQQFLQINNFVLNNKFNNSVHSDPCFCCHSVYFALNSDAVGLILFTALTISLVFRGSITTVFGAPFPTAKVKQQSE